MYKKHYIHLVKIIQLIIVHILLSAQLQLFAQIYESIFDLGHLSIVMWIYYDYHILQFIRTGEERGKHTLIGDRERHSAGGALDELHFPEDSLDLRVIGKVRYVLLAVYLEIKVNRVCLGVESPDQHLTYFDVEVSHPYL